MFLLRAFVILLCLVASAFGQTLRFTEVSLNSSNSVYLSVAGPSNTICYFERAAYATNFSWESVSTYALGTNGLATLTDSLHGQTNGVFRTRATKNAAYSTKAAAVLVGYCQPGFQLIGNPFGYNPSFTNIFPNPLESLSVYFWTGTAFQVSEYIDGSWSGSSDINEREGIFVRSYSTNQVQKYVISSLFPTKSIVLNLATNQNLIVSQRFWPIQSGFPTIVDSLNSGRLVGYSELPVQGISTNQWTHVSIWQYATQAYLNYGLTNGNWRSGTNLIPATLTMGEGLFFSCATTFTLTIDRKI
jgi:hypothetical protein